MTTHSDAEGVQRDAEGAVGAPPAFRKGLDWTTSVFLETVGSGKDLRGMATARKYPVELKERALAMVRELQYEHGGGSGRGVIARVAEQLGVHPEALRSWVRAEDRGKHPSGERVPGSASDKDARISELERENRELRRANSILKAASAFMQTPRLCGVGPWW